MQLVKQRGGRVIATTSNPEKAELARGAGADEVILGLDGDHGLNEALEHYACIAEAVESATVV